MEIRLKTAQEFRDAHMTIEIRVDGQAELEAVRDRLYDPDKAADTLAENYQRAKARIDELAGQLADFRELAEFKSRVIDEITAERNILARRLADIKRVVSSSEVSDTLEQVTTKVSSRLADAIGDVRTIVDSSPTSQA